VANGGDDAPDGVLIHLPLHKETTMMTPSLFLRRALQADAIFSGIGALMFSLGASVLARLCNLPEPLLRETGLFLVAYAAFVGWLSFRETMPRIFVGVVVIGNAAWTVASIALLFSGAVTPNLSGEALVAAQAIVVGLLAELQFIGLRRSSDLMAA
jgi:hypothetical protein